MIKPKVRTYTVITSSWTIDELILEKMQAKRAPPNIIIANNFVSDSEFIYTILVDDNSYLLSSTREYLVFSTIDSAANFLAQNSIFEFKVDLQLIASCTGSPPTSSPRILTERNGKSCFMTRSEIDSSN